MSRAVARTELGLSWPCSERPAALNPACSERLLSRCSEPSPARLSSRAPYHPAVAGTVGDTLALRAVAVSPGVTRAPWGYGGL